jgi:hypothetical protein
MGDIDNPADVLLVYIGNALLLCTVGVVAHIVNISVVVVESYAFNSGRSRHIGIVPEKVESKYADISGKDQAEGQATFSF